MTVKIDLIDVLKVICGNKSDLRLLAQRFTPAVNHMDLPWRRASQDPGSCVSVEQAEQSVSHFPLLRAC